MTFGFHGLPQNSLNHLPTMALFSWGLLSWALLSWALLSWALLSWALLSCSFDMTDFLLAADAQGLRGGRQYVRWSEYEVAQGKGATGTYLLILIPRAWQRPD